MSAEAKTSVVQKTVETPADHLREPQGPLASSLAKGEIPSNENINYAINNAKESIENTKSEGDLSSKGQQLAQDTENILSSAQRFINEKNKDGKLQDLVRHTREASEEAAAEASRLSHPHMPSFLKPGQKAHMTKDARSAYNHGKDLAMFMFKSTDFRSFIIELIEFCQSMITGSAERINRLGDSLKQDVAASDRSMNQTHEQARLIGRETIDSFYDVKYDWTEERRDEIYNRFRGLLEKASQSKEWNQIINIFWKWMDQMRTRAEVTKDRVSSKIDDMKDRAQNSQERLEQSSALDKMWEDVKAIIDQFAGKGSFDHFYNQTWTLYCELLNDPVAEEYFNDVKAFVNDAMDRPEQLASDQKTLEGQRLIERGRVLMTSEKYQFSFRSLFYNGKELLYKIRDDAATQDFKQKLKLFGEHFALDANGRPDLYVLQESTLQLKNLVYPLMRDKLGSMKVSKIAGTSDKFDYEIENLVICVPDLLPKSFELQTKSDMQVDLEDTKSREMSFKVQLDLAKLKPVFKDVKFWYKRKSFPKIEDHGLVDVDLSAGEGTRIKIVWKITAAAEKSFTFSLIDVRATVDKMDIHVKNAKHEALDKVATALFVGKIKQAIAQSIVDGIVKALQPLNDQMNQWFASRPVGTITDKANAELHNAFDRSNQALKEPEKLKEKARDAIDSAKYKMEASKDTVKDKAQDLKEAATEKYEDVKDSARDAKGSMEDRRSDKYAWDHRWTKTQSNTAPLIDLDIETTTTSYSNLSLNAEGQTVDQFGRKVEPVGYPAQNPFPSQ